MTGPLAKRTRGKLQPPFPGSPRYGRRFLLYPPHYASLLRLWRAVAFVRERSPSKPVAKVGP
jgi:hypothetical protein